jgi:YidC/Oxa1 family membrane protein insertase
VLIVLYVGSQLFSTLLMSTTTDRNQKMIMLALPFVFVIFVIQFPAGLLLYWITTNCWTIVQQAIVRKRLGPLRPPETAMAAVAQAEAEDKEREREKRKTTKDRELVASSGSGRSQGRPAGPPPAPPRKKKKRSGRRR